MTPELLSPAGDFETALAAFAAGADAVYCGLSSFSARAFAKNFSSEDLKKLVRHAHARGKKVYVTFNTVQDESSLDAVKESLAELEMIGPDALIVQDLGIARICRGHFPGLRLHASTQLVAHNLEGVLALGEVGFERVVLARELSADEVASLAKRCGKTELEVFIHGALCYSLSGLCLYGAMEKGRSGNRGACPYCCRQEIDGRYPFSMKDLRVGEDVRKLVQAGAASLKIEGRMKTPLYVATATAFYRDILDGTRARVTTADLETVFARRTTELYVNGRPSQPQPSASTASPVDPERLGHCGAPIGTVKRVTKDREGRSWLRFHTARTLERHDGLQFDALTEKGRPYGFGISEMRAAISRVNVFEVPAGTDVEVLLPVDAFVSNASAPHVDAARTPRLRAGDTVYCAMSNAVKRRFPAPAYRASDDPGPIAVDVSVTLAKDGVSVVTPEGVTAGWHGSLDAAKNPDKTYAAVEKAFSKFGETDYRLGKLTLVDPDRRFVPMSVLNDLRRDLVEALDAARDKTRRTHLEAALADDAAPAVDAACRPRRLPTPVLKLRPDQPVPPGDWAEIVCAINAETDLAALPQPQPQPQPSTSTSLFRLALPVYTPEADFNRLRSAVKRFLRAGYAKWECSDLATLRMLRQLEVADITVDWSGYAFNAQALALWTERGAQGFVASPENNGENRTYLAESGYPVAFLKQQSTPLFISLTKPALEEEPEELAVYERDGLWVTTKRTPRIFPVPADAPQRVDLSWDPPCS